jgi:serine/threonine-protein kinase
VWAAQALVARAQADPLGQRRAVEGFLETAARPAVGLDLTLGRSSALLAAGLLLDALPPGELVEPGPLRAFGQRALEEVWAELDRKPEIPRAGIEYLGIAHGWAGFLYATLVWCQVSGAPLPAGVPRRLEELADLALPVGRGLAWPWTLRPDGEPAVMPGWCNGSCGYVFLWTLAHRRTGRGRFLDLALGAGWDSFDSPEPAITLCCGRAGRGYALLNLYRHTGDGAWLERARTVALAAARSGALADEHPHALYKGELGLAVLAADLEQPGESAMPFFEPLGYGGGG